MMKAAVLREDLLSQLGSGDGAAVACEELRGEGVMTDLYLTLASEVASA